MTPFWADQPRDVLRVTGDDALTYLHGQVSQDLQQLADGASAYTFVLQPTGKVETLARIRRVSAGELLLDTDAGCGDALQARLNRFKIRVKVGIEPVASRCIAVRGVAARPAGAVPAWGRDDAFDLFDAPPPEGVREGSAADLERARIAAGWPAMGAEITEATIPAETGVTALAVNFTKGCYPGQELVERMDSRGSTAPRFVRRLHGAGAVAVGDELTHDGKVVGHITSLVPPTDDGWLALAVVARSVEPGDAVTIGGTPVIVEAISR